MVLESTMICVDNSDYMRNGDFVPTRLQAQQDAVNLVCHSKIRSNPENNVGLLTLANVEVLATLTSDVGRILSKLHQVQPQGNIKFLTGIRIAHLALKHRQGKNHKMRIVAFVGSPVQAKGSDLIRLAKRLKKEKVNVDIVSFGEEVNPKVSNNDLLTAFINALNGRDGGSSHLVTVPPGPHLSDALLSSPVIQGEDGMGGAGLGASGFEFGVDPNEDPELALALRVSMEEQRQRQEEEARRAQAASAPDGAPQPADTIKEEQSEEALLERALAMSLEGGAEEQSSQAGIPDFSKMTEEEQIALAMQMSMQDAQPEEVPMKEEGSSSVKEEKTETPMEVEGDDDYSEVMNDPEFLQSVLENLPGVDPQSEAIRKAVGSLKDKKESDKKDRKDDDKGKK
ncbi:26S proteasome non-ATPase regulatory subunit 4 [Schistocerca serialis cubense]|uniref:26S proteasome non-ATPase regulatory subunit 4 n=1 Tax=Schistocerca serialis cubense TaxID=2023355 RepID=UPI00214EDB28|nr:26S proteasome non-ATPase regulatory subunit 4 [Schistocerca serialis cubense]